jgi:hypothetical protein
MNLPDAFFLVSGGISLIIMSFCTYQMLAGPYPNWLERLLSAGFTLFMAIMMSGFIMIWGSYGMVRYFGM